MFRVVMFDLGLTLVDSQYRPFAGVEEALTEISRLRTAEGDPLKSCLVSDFEMASPPMTKVTALFNEYLVILERSGLRRFFEPVDERVTLSTHAEALKPDRRIFDKALQRLGMIVPLPNCLFITENSTHIERARNDLNMHVLQFGAGSPFGFDDWREAPALIADRLRRLS
jgi:beta-phosphoglucomutase-like phosphatase (HAD superfamily)